MSAVVRFAPSPTGFIHIGNARTALLNALFARPPEDRVALLRQVHPIRPILTYTTKGTPAYA